MDDELTTAVRTVARAADPYTGSLDGIYGRARRRRTRRLAAATAAAVALILVGVGVPLARHNKAAPPQPATSTPPPRIVPAIPGQRLTLHDATGTLYGSDRHAVEAAGPNGVTELLPDGRVTTYPKQGDARAWQEVVQLSDGGLVATGPVYPGPGATYLELSAVGADGQLRVKRDISREDMGVTLLGADSTTAYLWRRSPDGSLPSDDGSQGLFAYELATGIEWRMLEASVVDDGQDWLKPGAADVLAGRLAVPDPADRCGIRVFDLTTAQVVAERKVSLEGCEGIEQMRLSPDGSKAAVLYRMSEDVLRVEAYSLTGAASVDNGLREFEHGTQPARASIAWDDDATVRVALIPDGYAAKRVEQQKFDVTN